MPAMLVFGSFTLILYPCVRILAAESFSKMVQFIPFFLILGQA
jgi:hypothetical protein